MDDAEHIVAVVDRVHDHPHRVNVVDLLERAPLHIHLAVDPGDAFDPARDKGFEVEFREPFPDPLLDAH